MKLVLLDAMNVGHARAITNTCERCHKKMQEIAEMLVLTFDARPIRTESTLSSQITSPSILRDQIFSKIKSILTLMKAIVTHVHMIATKWIEICEGIQELSMTAITFTELCTHSAYLVAVNCKGCEPAEEGLVDKYNVGLAGLEIKISCNRLKRARVEELSPQLIIDLCSNISKHISVITDICRVAGDRVNDESTEDQFKLCVKSVTCAAGCLIASIKTYKSRPSSSHHSRVLVFCEPVLASSNALVSFATEEDFIGRAALLTPEARDTQKAVLGACMSIVSACIQLCKTVRDLAYDMMTSHHREKLRMCTDSVDRTSAQLTELLNKHAMSEEAFRACMTPHSHDSASTQGSADSHENSSSVNNESVHSDCNSTSVYSSENSSNSLASR